jgi:hypothetical protein
MTFRTKLCLHVSSKDPSFHFSFHANKIVKILRGKDIAKLLGAVSVSQIIISCRVEGMFMYADLTLMTYLNTPFQYSRGRRILRSLLTGYSFFLKCHLTTLFVANFK